jgi:hypothetical protein
MTVPGAMTRKMADPAMALPRFIVLLIVGHNQKQLHRKVRKGRKGKPNQELTAEAAGSTEERRREELI